MKLAFFIIVGLIIYTFIALMICRFCGMNDVEDD